MCPVKQDAYLQNARVRRHNTSPAIADFRSGSRKALSKSSLSRVPMPWQQDDRFNHFFCGQLAGMHRLLSSSGHPPNLNA
jgi:hypothetical protein